MQQSLYVYLKGGMETPLHEHVSDVFLTRSCSIDYLEETKMEILFWLMARKTSNKTLLTFGMSFDENVKFMFF